MSAPPLTCGLDRRRFLRVSGAALVGAAMTGSCRHGDAPPAWASVRLVHGRRASSLEHAVLRDVAGLLERAVGAPIRVVVENEPWGPADILVGTAASSVGLLPAWQCADATPGAFRVHAPGGDAGPGLVIAGADAEGTRNGLYRYLESLGFGFFRDGEQVPFLGGAIPGRVSEFSARPAFRWRGDMFWDNYLGPRRYCPAAWGADDWERALLFVARNGLNFVEFYPPMDDVWRRAFPDSEGLDEGAVWGAGVKQDLARHVLARGRALGIRFMYVLTYGAFPEAVRRLYPGLEWANGFLCGHQPELQAFTRRTWRLLLDTFGTDHLYAIRHRGEEGQEYSDPCRSVTKAAGFSQAIEIVRALDAEATVSVWTWGENVPALFAQLPPFVRAAHVRHGMGGVFAEVGQGREQADGPPPLPSARRWFSAQFTVFSGSEAALQTAWCDADSLAADARAAAADPRCEAYFQWPEWSNTSPWVSHVVARLAWAPAAFHAAHELDAYASARHGPYASLFLSGVRPLLEAGNARFMVPPRKRLIVPYFLFVDEMVRLARVRAGLRVLVDGLPEAVPSLLARDAIDLLTWVAMRQAHVLEAAAYLAQGNDDGAGTRRCIDAALSTWSALRATLALSPELSIVETAHAMASAAPVSGRALDSFWTNACDFYKGYPLAPSPEAVELVFSEQCRRLGAALEAAMARGTAATLGAPGWFWHDFPDPAWAEAVVELPREDATAFETEMRRRLAAALDRGAGERVGRGPAGREEGFWADLGEDRRPPSVILPVSRDPLRQAAVAILAPELPASLSHPPLLSPR